MKVIVQGSPAEIGQVKNMTKIINAVATRLDYEIVEVIKESKEPKELLKELVEALSKGVVVFEYRTAQNVLRKAVGTTERDLVAMFMREYGISVSGTGKKNEHLVTYFDLEKKGFRNFHVGRVERIIGF